MASMQELILQTLNAIHAAINQVNMPAQMRLKLLIDNTKYLLTIAPIDEDEKKSLREKIDKIENVLINFEKVELEQSKITTFSEVQNKTETEMKKKEKLIIDRCMDVVAEVLKDLGGEMLWQ